MSQIFARPCSRRTLYPVAIVLVALLILGNLMLIFSFSSESREESGSRSREVTRTIARTVYAHFHDFSEAEQDEIVDSLHGLVRKTAHFLEFALLGCLSAILAHLVRGCFRLTTRALLTVGAPALFCLLSAIADETYQIFTNRGASPVDVCIDFGGAVSGILFLHAVVWLGTVVRRRGQVRQTPQKRKEGVSP